LRQNWQRKRAALMGSLEARYRPAGAA
jgi:hypothetical protein